MNDCLRLAIGYMDGDGTARLDAAVQCKGFCGNSSGWFGISQLEEFSDLLLAYPLPVDGHPPLRAGFWSRIRQGEIDQLHVSLRVYPVGRRGAVGCLVTLRTPLNDGDKSKVSEPGRSRTSNFLSGDGRFLTRAKKAVASRAIGGNSPWRRDLMLAQGISIPDGRRPHRVETCRMPTFDGNWSSIGNAPRTTKTTPSCQL
jgi:hypothetical protein